MRPSDVVELSLGENYRAIIISDIHGADDLFTELLAKCEYDPLNDWLFIIGDIVEKGTQSLQTLEHIMELSQNGRCVVLQGNNDTYPLWLLSDADEEKVKNYLVRRRSDKSLWLVRDMADAIGIECTDCYQEPARKAIWERFNRQLRWIENLPVAIETEEFLISHSGIDTADWRNLERKDLLFNHEFIYRGSSPNEKWSIAGHMPVINIPESKAGHNVLVLEERRIIATDGGLADKSCGQLNALIVYRDGGATEFANVFRDRHPTASVLSDYEPEPCEYGFIKSVWPDFDIEVLEEGQYFSVCKTNNGKIGMLKNEHIDAQRKTVLCNSNSHFLHVRSGDIVYVIDGSCEGYSFVKNKKGTLGWIPNHCIK